MSLITVSQKRARTYERKFDHDRARELRANGWTYTRIAEHFGVTAQAVSRICDPRIRKKMDERVKQTMRNMRRPCKGGCGQLVWMHQPEKASGYCLRCLAAQKTAADVRETELRCKRCREWKPDDEFPTYKGVVSRRGRRMNCRACETAIRRAYRHSHPDQERAALRRARTSRKERTRMATTYVVLRPNGNGSYTEHARTTAINATQAIESTATEPGEYVAVVEDRLVPVTVAPVQAFKVVA